MFVCNIFIKILQYLSIVMMIAFIMINIDQLMNKGENRNEEFYNLF